MRTHFIRDKEVAATFDKCRATAWVDAKHGLITEPVKIGPNTTGWPAHEIETIARARSAGYTDDMIRALVDRLHAKRQEAAAELEAELGAPPDVA